MESQVNLKRASTRTANLPQKRLAISTEPFDHLTHYLFRYPAKFHPPVARALLDRFTRAGQVVFDPFVGSGSLLVEALAMGRNAIGLDIDPVAVAVASAKIHRYDPKTLRTAAAAVVRAAKHFERPTAEYERRMFEDLSEREYRAQSREFAGLIPEIPNLEHWFRRYVVVDLARIRTAIASVTLSKALRSFFNVIFASIIRNASNADPVPVSGLEVTAYMKERDRQGRLVNPFSLFERATTKSIEAAESFYNSTTPSVSSLVMRGDAIEADSLVNGIVDVVITSPPYHGAVDYYRRHQLEMFWLGEIDSHQDRLDLLPQYIGRTRVAKRALATLNLNLTVMRRSYRPRRFHDNLRLVSQLPGGVVRC